MPNTLCEGRHRLYIDSTTLHVRKGIVTDCCTCLHQFFKRGAVPGAGDTRFNFLGWNRAPKKSSSILSPSSVAQNPDASGNPGSCSSKLTLTR